MTKYLSPGPFSGPTSNGHMSDLDYQIAVGAMGFCEACRAYVAQPHVHTPDLTEPEDDSECCGGCGA